VSRFVLTLLLGTGLAGCALEPIPGMELKCQITKCTPSAVSFPVRPEPQRVPVLWKDNGNAYCPEGHVLREIT
jgi:hypothetical protein